MNQNENDTDPAWLVIDEVDEQLRELRASHDRWTHRRHLCETLGACLTHTPDTVLAQEIELGQLHTQIHTVFVKPAFFSTVTKERKSIRSAIYYASITVTVTVTKVFILRFLLKDR